MKITEFKKYLNPSQLEAVTTIDGPVLVIAGAGSGKTRIIEYRVLHLIRNNVDPGSILLLTFTRKAAREMLSRAEKHDERARHVDGGTFHSFAFKILKRYAGAIGFTDSFSILDEADSEDAAQKCANALGLSEKSKRFPRKSTLRNIISVSVNKELSIEQVLEKEYPHFLDHAPDIDRIRKEYAAYKIRKNYVDYDDLLTYLRLLLKKESVRKAISERYRYIMVDEYQDTNNVQGDIACLLARERQNILVVGDDAQTIYGFRGSSHENIMRFPEIFPGCKVIKLEENYRSSQSVLDVANAVMESMDRKYPKYLTASKAGPCEKPKLLFFKDIYQEAEWVAGRVKELRDNGEDLGDIAVLVRSAFISIVLQAELGKCNIPFQLFGGLRFYETAHVKDVIAHLKVILNRKDELSWVRVLSLIEGIGPKNADRLTEEITAAPSFEAAISDIFTKYGKGFKYSGDLKKLGGVLKSCAAPKSSVGAMYSTVLDYYIPLMKLKYDDWHIRLNDLEALRQISDRYNSLQDLLADFSIEPPERSISDIKPNKPDDERPMTLSTIHSAKGLEWKNVFLLGMVDGILPISFALDNADEIEEEKRLFYVAITRAKDNLVLTLHHEGSRGGINQFNKVSRFINSHEVLATLEQDVIFEPGHKTGYRNERSGLEDPIYDKDSLLQDILDSFD